MNRRTQGLLLSEAINGFTKYKVVEGLSPRTLESYSNHLARFQDYLDNPPLADISAEHINDFLFWLRSDYKPQRLTGNGDPLSPKTLYNFWVTLKSFFTWAQKSGFLDDELMAIVPRPKFTVEPVAPFTREELERLVQACKYSRVSLTNGRLPFKMVRPTFRRDEAICLFLLDTGLRASEFCALRVADVDMKTGEITVRHGRAGGAKGGKGRSVYIGKATRKAIWRYLVEGEDGEEVCVFR